jgi:phytoene dehydrogenase-like protein
LARAKRYREVGPELGITYEAGRPKHIGALLDGKLYSLSSTLGILLQSRMLGAQDKIELTRIFAGLPKLDARTLAVAVSVEHWLDQTTGRPVIRRLLAGLARTALYSPALDVASAQIVVEWLQRTARHSVHYVHGGRQTLVDGLQQAATEAGARIVRGVQVLAIEQHLGRLEGVQRRDGTLAVAAALVIATTPQEAAFR